MFNQSINAPGLVLERARRFVVLTVGVSLAVQPILTPLAQAQQITDPRAPIQFRPSISTSSNGTPVVNITTPGFGNLSHNKFERYNVDTRGVILNNSGYNGTSVIGGAVTANPNLVGRRSASVILNEVTGSSASTLNGPTEVFGARADVIIANPNGVGCVGCTFINAGRVTLSSGVPIPDYTFGTVRYQVTGGTVSVSGEGLRGGNSETLGKIDLIGRQLRIEGPIIARDAVRLRAGAVDYDPATDTGIVVAGAPALSGLAISSSSQGSIRAGTISVLSRDIDLGVSLSGTLQALAGDIVVRAGGDVAVAEAYSAGDLEMASDGRILLAGRKEALGTISVRGRSVELALSSSIAANNPVVIAALDALVARGTIQSGQTIALTAGGTLAATGVVSALGRIILEGDRVVTNDFAVGAEHILIAGLTDVALLNSGFRSRTEISIAGHDVTLGLGTGFEAAGRLRVDARNSLTHETILDQANLDLTIRNRLVVASTGALVRDLLLLNIRDEIINAGTLIGRQGAEITTTTLENSGTGVIYGDGVRVSLSGSLTNLGKLVSDRTLAIITGGAISNDGLIQARGALDLVAASYRAGSNEATLAGHTARLIVAGAFDNHGQVFGVQGLTLGAVSLDNRGAISSGSLMTLTIAGDIDNRGVIGATSSLSIVAGGALRTPGHIVSETGDLTLAAGGAVISGGDIIAAGRVVLSAGSYESNTVTARLAGARIDARLTGAFTNLGLVTATDRLGLDAASLSNGPADPVTGQGSILARDLSISSLGLIENHGVILSEAEFTVTGGALANAGVLSGKDSGSIRIAGLINNTGTLAFNSALDLTAARYSGGASSVLSADRATLAISGDITNAGQIVASAGLSIVARGLSNQGANSSLAAQALTITLASSLSNDGRIAAFDTVGITAGSSVTNAGTLLAGNGALSLVAGGSVSSTGDILAGGALTLNAAGFSGSGPASRLAGASVAITLGSGAFSNQGIVTSLGNLDLSAGAFTNSGTIDGSRLIIRLSADAGNSGTIASRDILDLASTGGGLTNQTGAVILAGTSGQIDFAGAIRNDGTLAAHDALTLNGASYLATHSAAALLATNLAITTTGTFDSAGRVVGERRLSLAAGSFALRGASQIMGGADTRLTLRGDGLNEGVLIGTDALTLVAQGAFTNRGTLQSDRGDVNLQVTGNATNDGAILALGRLDLVAGGLSNLGTTARLASSGMALSLTGDLANHGAIVSTAGLTISARTLSQSGGGALIQADGLSITLTGNASNQGSLQSLGALMLSAAGALDNQGLIAGGTVATVSTGAGLSNAGRLVANDLLTVNAASLTMLAASRLGGTDTRLIIAGAINNAGTLFALNDLTLTSAGLVNQSGAVISAGAGDLRIAGNLDNSGTIKASWLTGTVSGSLTNTGTLASTSDLSLAISGAITNSGLIQATGVNQLTGASLSNLASGRIEGTQIGLTLSGHLGNHGTILASDLAVLSAASLANEGAGRTATIAADRLGLTIGGHLDNRPNALLQGATTAQVRAGSVNAGFLTRPDIASGRFNFSRNLDLTLTASGYTFDQQLMVAGDLRLAARGDIVNNSIVAAGGTLALLSDQGSIANNQGATLYSVGNMHLQAAGSITNNAGTIQSLADMGLVAGGEVRNARSASNLTWETLAEGEAAHASGDTRVWFVSGGNLWRLLMVYQKDVSTPGMIDAQGSLSIQAGSVTNDASVISVGRDLVINAGSFNNAARFAPAGYHQWKLTGSGTGYRGFGLCCGDPSRIPPAHISPSSESPASLTVGGNFAFSGGSFANSGTLTANTAIIQAPSVTLGVTDPNVLTPVARLPASIIDLTHYVSVIPVTQTITPVSTQPNVPAVIGTSVAVSPERPVTETVGFSPRDVALPPIDGTMLRSVDPGQPAAITPTVSFLHRSPLPGSTAREPSWILGEVGDVRADLTFFADPLTERRIIQQALLDQTGRSLIDPSYRNPQIQQEELYKGTVDFLKSNPTLRLGETLTEAQRAGIQTPLLWYETRLIDGRNVLVPQILLPPGDLEKYRRTTGGLVSAEELLIKGDQVTNTGTLLATKNLVIEAGEFLNERRIAQTPFSGRADIPWFNTIQPGGVLAAENILITTDRDLINRGGMISATSDISLASLHGSILNEAARGQSYLTFKKGYGIKPEIAAGQITAGDELTITAGEGQFRNIASDLAAFGDLSVTARDGISVESIAETYLSAYSKSGSFFNRKSSFTVTPVVFSSSIRSLDGDVLLSTDGDLTLKGGAIEATLGSIEARAKDILLETVSAEGLHKTFGMKIGFTGASGYRNVWNDFAVSQPILAAGTDIKLLAAGDLTGKGSVFDAGGDITLLADRNITLDANQNTRFYTSKSWSVGLTYPGSAIIAAIESGAKPEKILEAAISQDPLGAAVLSLSKGGGGGAAIRTALGVLEIAGGMGRGLSNPNPLTGGTNGALDFLTKRINDNLNPIHQWGSLFNPNASGFGNLGAATFGISFSITKSKSLWTESQRSSLSAFGDITIAAGLDDTGDLKLHGGTNVVADGDITLSGTNISIEALKDWNWSSTKTVGGGITLSSTGLGLSGHTSQKKSQGEDYSNAALLAGGDLKVTTPGDLAVVGGTLRGERVEIDVGGDLDLVSVQDWQRTRGFSVSGGVMFTPIPLPDSFGLGQVKGNRSWSEVSEIVGRGDTVIRVGGNLDLKASTLASETGKLDLAAGSLTVSDHADVDTYLDWSFGVSGLSKVLNGTTLPGLKLDYESRNMRGTTYATLGDGKIVIGGEENPIALGTINRDPAGRQVVTINESTKFSLDIPVLDFKKIADDARSATDLMRALTTPVPDEVAAMGPEYADYYRRAIAGGKTPQEAEAFVSSPAFADTVSKFDTYNKLVEKYGSEGKIPSQYAYALALDLDAQLDENGQLYIRADCAEAQPGPCARLGIDPTKPLSRAQLQALLTDTYEALGDSLTKRDIADVLKANTRYALALQCALNWMKEGGSAGDMYQLVFGGATGTDPAENARKFVAALGGTSSLTRSRELAQGLEILSYVGTGDLAGLKERFVELQAMQTALVQSPDARKVQEGIELSKQLYKVDAILKAYEAGNEAEATRLLNFALTFDTSVVLASLQGATIAGRGSSGLRGFTPDQVKTIYAEGLNPKYVNKDGSLKYPASDGFVGPITKETMPVGSTFDRYGGRFEDGVFKDPGDFAAPVGTPFGERSLPPSNINRPYTTYEVVKPIPDVTSGTTAPWFGQSGGGTQYRLPHSIEYLLNNGYILPKSQKR